MLLLKKLKQEGFNLNKLPDDVQQAANTVLASTDESQKIQMLDLVTYKTVRKLYKTEVENTITDIAFKNMPGNDGFNTRVADKSFAAGGETDQQPPLVSVIEERLPKVLHEDTLKIEYVYKTDGGYVFNMISRTDYPVNRATPKLQRIGIKVERTGEKGKRLITIPESIFNSWTRKSYAAGGTTETRYQIKNKDGGYYSRLGGAEHFNSVPDFGLFYSDEEVEDVKEYLEKKGYKNLHIVPYVPQHEHAYKSGGSLSVRAEKQFNPDYYKIFSDGEEVKTHFIHRERATWLDSSSKYSFVIVEKENKKESKPFKTLSEALAEFKSNYQKHSYAAGGPIETPQQLGSALKAYFKKKYNLDILTRYIKTVRGLDGSWYEISTFRSGKIIPNEVRQEIIKRFHPNANITNWDDVSYGNVRSQNVSLYGQQWKEFLQAQEGKMAKGGPTMGEIIKANKNKIILARPAGGISDKQMDMKEFTELIKKIKPFTPGHQLNYLGNLYRSEEKDGAIEIAKRLITAIEKMPKTYGTENTPTDEKIIYLHYFQGGSDWYIVEKDSEPEQHQAYGYVIMNGDHEMAEWGYISIKEIKGIGKIELDFYFDPIKFGELKKKWEPDSGKVERAIELLKDVEDKSVVARISPIQFKKFEENENENYHIENHLLLAEATGDKLLIESAKLLLKEYEKADHLTGDLQKLSNRLTSIIKMETASETKPAAGTQQPKWLFIGHHVNASVYCDKRKEVNGDYKEIVRVVYQPLELSVNYKNKNEEYDPIVEMAKREYRDLFNKNPGQLPNGTATYSKVQLSHKEIMKEDQKVQSAVTSFESKAYANAYELNKAIEKLLDSKPNDDDFTGDEKTFLKYYSGYGGLEKFGAIGKGLLYEYFTPSLIAEKMWGLAYKHGFKGGSVFEPSAGIGEFIKYAPEQHLVVAHEINKYSARICKILYPLITISTQYFEQIFIKNNDSIKGKINLLPKYKLVIGNPPYGEFGGKWAGMGEKSYTRAGNYIDYFIFRGLDLLEPGGLLVFIVGAEVASGGKCFLSQQMNKCKDEIMEKSELLDAYRLPNGVFERTDVLSDIIVLRKK